MAGIINFSVGTGLKPVPTKTKHFLNHGWIYSHHQTTYQRYAQYQAGNAYHAARGRE